MSVIDGQKATAEVFNDAFVSKTSNSTVVGKISLQNVDTALVITDLQRAIAQSYDVAGIVNETDANAKQYGSVNFIQQGDNRKVALERLDAAIKAVQDQLNFSPNTDNYIELDNNDTQEITDLLFDSEDVLSFEIKWTVYRESTGTGAVIRAQRGLLYGVFNGTIWTLTDMGRTGEDCGLEFLIDETTGQISTVTDDQDGDYDADLSYLVYKTSETTLVREVTP